LSDAAVLLAGLLGLGVEFNVEGGMLVYDAPAGTMTPDLLAALVAHKAEVLGLLADEGFRRVAARMKAAGDDLWRDRIASDPDLAAYFAERQAIHRAAAAAPNP
jgi:hypothetical protein